MATGQVPSPSVSGAGLEALIAAVVDAGCTIVFSHTTVDGGHRVVLERFRRSMDLERVVSEILREAFA
jgi:hypothetical protein